MPFILAVLFLLLVAALSPGCSEAPEERITREILGALTMQGYPLPVEETPGKPRVSN